MKISMLFGDEFWERYELLISKAQSKIYIVSAYIGKTEWERTHQLKKSEVPMFTICREDSGYTPRENTFLISKELYHGKMYVIDNVVLIGSQNLYNANKNGEFTVEFDFDNLHEASLIAYQGLLKTCEKVYPRAEPVHPSFLQFYNSFCPFCNGEPADPFSVYACSEYGGDFVTDDECESYFPEGACKYCDREERTSLGECYACDGNGCGFGIRVDTGELIYNQFLCRQHGSFENAYNYLSLYNYFAGKNSVFAYNFFSIMGFTGKIFTMTQKKILWEASRILEPEVEF